MNHQTDMDTLADAHPEDVQGAGEALCACTPLFASETHQLAMRLYALDVFTYAELIG